VDMTTSLPQLDGADVALLERSFDSAMRNPEAFGQRFYERLFTLAPSVRPLFPEDLVHQQKKLTQAIAMLMTGLARPAALAPGLRQLGARHSAYGAGPMHYVVVGEAMIETVAELCDPALDDSGRAAWMRLYGWVAATMLEGTVKADEAA